MVSAVITALLFVVMLLIVANLVASALREHRRHLQTLAKQAPDLLPTPDHRGTGVLPSQNGTAVGIQKPTSPFILSLPASWYQRRRTIVSVGFLFMLLLGLFLQSGLADGALEGISRGFGLLNFRQHTSAFDLSTVSLPMNGTASSRIVRVDSGDRRQYYTDYQWRVWAYSSCSGISMEEVMNAYGRHLIAADVLQVEANLGVWNIYEGLTGGEAGIAKAANYFGFKAVPNPPRTLPDLINVTNRGFPVIVGIPGHILVVHGGDSNHVYLVDSAPANRTILTHQQFLDLWDKFSVELVPR
jgi:Papain-like cysteine protease AvrRpt2